MTECIYKEPRTTVEDTEDRLHGNLEHDWFLLRALKSQGVIIGSAGGHDHVIMNPEVAGLEPPPPDDEHPTLKLPIVLARGVYLPLEDRTLSSLAVLDHWMKTPAKKRKLILACTRELPLPRYIAIEAGDEYSLRAIATAATAELAERAALNEVGAKPGEKVRAVLLECRGDKLAAEIAETNRGTLPWTEATVRHDGELPALWHGCSPKWDETARAKAQEDLDLRGKRSRRARVIRQMSQEPL